MKKISIIIPIYNAENYIRRCIESIESSISAAGIQSENEVEIILVNDGSTDQSLQICEELAGGNSMIHLINQENGGVSKARNQGLAAAEGQYIAFADADDYISESYFQDLIPLLDEGVDLVLFNHYKESPQGVMNQKSLPLVAGTHEKDMQLANLPLSWRSNQVWDKIFKGEIIEKNRVRFPVGMKTSEDLLFFMKYVSYVHKYVFFDKSLYYYKYIETGAVNKHKAEYLDDLRAVYRQGLAYCKTNDFDEMQLRKFQKVVLWQILNLAAETQSVRLAEALLQRLRNDSYLKDLLDCRAVSKQQKVYQILIKHKRYKLMCGLYKLTRKVKQISG